MKKIIFSLLVLLIVSTGIACACAADANNATVDNDSIQITDNHPVTLNATDDQDIDNLNEPVSDIGAAPAMGDYDCTVLHGCADNASQDKCDLNQSAELNTTVSKVSNQDAKKFHPSAVQKFDDSVSVVTEMPKSNGDDRDSRLNDVVKGYYTTFDHWENGLPDFILHVYKDHSWNDTVWIVHKLMYRFNKHTPFTLEKVNKYMEDMRDGNMVHFSNGRGDYDYYAKMMKQYEHK